MMRRIIVEILRTPEEGLGVLLQIGARDGSTVISLNVYQVWSYILKSFTEVLHRNTTDRVSDIESYIKPDVSL